MKLSAAALARTSQAETCWRGPVDAKKVAVARLFLSARALVNAMEATAAERDASEVERAAAATARKIYDATARRTGPRAVAAWQRTCARLAVLAAKRR